MNTTLPSELEALEQRLEATACDAEQLVDGLSEEAGTARVEAGSWSVAECLDHLVIANRHYLDAMGPPAERAREKGKLRRRPALPGWIGGAFVAQLEPPPKWWSRLRAPRKIQPRPSPPLAGTYAALAATQAKTRAFLRAHADLDLAGIRFPNPFVPGIRFSLATGLHVIAAHEERHLLQAWRVRRAIASSSG